MAEGIATVEAPVTDWLQEAYEYSNARPSKGAPAPAKTRAKPARKAAVARSRRAAAVKKTAKRR